MAEDGSPVSTGVQAGVAARASGVRHTPPPAAPIHIRQSPAVHVGASAIAVTRPEYVVGVETNGETPRRTLGVTGPLSAHVVPSEAADRSKDGEAMREGEKASRPSRDGCDR